MNFRSDHKPRALMYLQWVGVYIRRLVHVTLSWVNMNFRSDHKPPALMYSQWVHGCISETHNCPLLNLYTTTLSWVNMNFRLSAIDLWSQRWGRIAVTTVILVIFVTSKSKSCGSPNGKSQEVCLGNLSVTFCNQLILLCTFYSTVAKDR